MGNYDLADMAAARRDLSEAGFFLLVDAVPQSVIADLRAAIAETVAAGADGHGVRDLPRRVAAVRALATSSKLLALASAGLDGEPRLIRGLLLDKNSERNWRVPWHRDLLIAVQRRVDLPGFGPWSLKDGVVHVQPPSPILEQRIALRVHLDDCGEDDGALRLLPGSHRSGALPGVAQAAVDPATTRFCAARSGDVLAMHPLLLHASAPARRPSHRRVIHLEYSSAALPAGLDWYEG